MQRRHKVRRQRGVPVARLNHAAPHGEGVRLDLLETALRRVGYAPAMTTFSAAPPFAIVIPRDEAETYWQRAPSHGTMNTILSPKNCPSNAFSVATQYIDAGCEIRPHAHERIEEILFLYEGHGTLTLEGKRIPVREGSTCLVGAISGIAWTTSPAT